MDDVTEPKDSYTEYVLYSVQYEYSYSEIIQALDSTVFSMNSRLQNQPRRYCTCMFRRSGNPMTVI